MVTIKYYSNDEISFDFPEDVKKNKVPYKRRNCCPYKILILQIMRIGVFL